jgi:peptidoglycan/xylan/chitin deacetylase (PgdA/CDA1 family)
VPPSWMTRIAASAASSLPFAWAVALLERLDREPPDLVRILTFHRVERAEAEPAPYPSITINPDDFAEQMRQLRSRYHPISMEELLGASHSRRGVPPRSVLITFDDGYRDFRTQAWPVLRGLGIPAALFVPTAFPGAGNRVFWWDRLYHATRGAAPREPLETPVGMLQLHTSAEREDAFVRLRDHAKRLRHLEALEFVERVCDELHVPPPPPEILSWEELRDLVREGLTVGSHTRTHPLLTRISEEEVRAEARESKRDLERELGSTLPILAYPGGAFDEGVARIAGEEGYRLGFTTTRGLNDLRRAHPLKLRRIHVGRRTSPPLLRAQLLARAASLNRFHRFPAGSAAPAR